MKLITFIHGESWTGHFVKDFSRKTGKTTLLKQQLSAACRIDLLDCDLFFSLNQNPKRLRQILIA